MIHEPFCIYLYFDERIKLRACTYATLKNALLLLLLNFLLLPELVVYRTQNEDNGSHDATQLGDESHRSFLRFDDSWRVEKKIASAFFSASESSSSSSSASLNMFLRGAALNDDDERANIKPGDTVLVNFQPVVSSSARSQQQTKLNKGKQSSSLNFLQRTLIRNRNKNGRGFFSFFLAQRCSIFHRHLQHGGDSVYIGNILLVLCREDGV